MVRALLYVIARVAENFIYFCRYHRSVIPETEQIGFRESASVISSVIYTSATYKGRCLLQRVKTWGFCQLLAIYFTAQIPFENTIIYFK